MHNTLVGDGGTEIISLLLQSKRVHDIDGEMQQSIILDSTNARRWHFAPFLNLPDRPYSMLGNQRIRVGRSVFQRRQIGQIAHVPQGNADIAQKTATLDSFDR